MLILRIIAAALAVLLVGVMFVAPSTPRGEAGPVLMYEKGVYLGKPDTAPPPPRFRFGRLGLGHRVSAQGRQLVRSDRDSGGGGARSSLPSVADMRSRHLSCRVRVSVAAN